MRSVKSVFLYDETVVIVEKYLCNLSHIIMQKAKRQSN